jgi:hypothetical protein
MDYEEFRQKFKKKKKKTKVLILYRHLKASR